ncbi:hypothetical protein BH20ACT9_BH20ACT9_01980 [soil metagenome]
MADDLVIVNVAIPRDRLADLYGLLAQWVAGEQPAGGTPAAPAGSRPTPSETPGERFKH